jgi:hypothetical protein
MEETKESTLNYNKQTFSKVTRRNKERKGEAATKTSETQTGCKVDKSASRS